MYVYMYVCMYVIVLKKNMTYRNNLVVSKSERLIPVESRVHHHSRTFGIFSILAHPTRKGESRDPEGLSESRELDVITVET